MRIASLSELVQSTSGRLSDARLDELRSTVLGRKPIELVSEERMRLRCRRLSEADFRPSQSDRERILGHNDLVDVNYLVRGFSASRAVCRIILRDDRGREIGFGTGFKVAPRVIMTNQHVLESVEVAAQALAEFDHELDVSGRPTPTTRFRLDPSQLFVSDPELDFAVVGLMDRPVFGQNSLASFGFLRMQPETGKVNVGEFVTIIQHPSGLPKQIALRENQLLAIEEKVLWYQSDTAPGSSGSAVLNDSWQIIALHHSGVPKTDELGRWLRRDGGLAGPETDEGDIAWRVNEGIRISLIVERLRTERALGPLHEELLAAIEGALRRESIAGEDSRRPRTSGDQVALETLPGAARVVVPVAFEIQMTGLGTPQAKLEVVPDSVSDQKGDVAMAGRPEGEPRPS